MERGAAKEAIEQVIEKLQERGFTAHLVIGAERTVVSVIGENTPDFIPYC